MADPKDTLMTVHTAPRNISVQHVVKLMATRGVDAVIVVDDLAPVGIVTARDIMARVTASGLDPAKVAVEAVMSSPLVTVAEDGSVSDALAVMGNHGIRRVPVVNEAGRLVMLLTMDDILMLNLADASMLADVVREQVRRLADGSPVPRGPRAIRFADVSPPPPSFKPMPRAPLGGIAIRSNVVRMVERRPMTRFHFATRAWYRRNRLPILLMAGAAVLGAMVTLYMTAFYGYKPSYYEPKEIGREIRLKQQELEQLQQNKAEQDRQMTTQPDSSR